MIKNFKAEEREDEVMPGITAIPHNEILRQCSRWKELYLNLLDEFQQYKYGTDVMIMNNDEVLAEKVFEILRKLMSHKRLTQNYSSPHFSHDPPPY